MSAMIQPTTISIPPPVSASPVAWRDASTALPSTLVRSAIQPAVIFFNLQCVFGAMRLALARGITCHGKEHHVVPSVETAG